MNTFFAVMVMLLLLLLRLLFALTIHWVVVHNRLLRGRNGARSQQFAVLLGDELVLLVVLLIETAVVSSLFLRDRIADCGDVLQQ